MSSEKHYDSYEADFNGDEPHFGSSSRPNNAKKKKPELGRKRGKTPSSFNGMHRRRRRKMAW